MRAGSAGRGGVRGEEGGGRWAFAQGANRCVYVPLQDTFGDYKRSALHYASSSGLESIVAKLLSLGANAALVDKVRACSYMNTCKCSVHVCMFVNVLLIRISLSIMHIIQTCYNATCVCVCVCRYTHTQAFWHMRMQNQMYHTWMTYA